MSFFRRKTEATAQKIIQAYHGASMYRNKESDQGVVSTSRTWTDKLPHPPNMNKYDDLNCQPEVHIAIELLTHMQAPSIYIQMPENDEKGNKIEADHKNLKVIEKWMRDKQFKSKYQQIIRTKIGKGFCPVEIQPDNSLKLLPPETFFIWRDKFGQVYRYTQEINSIEVARWERQGWRESFKHIEKFYTRQECEQVLKESTVTVGKFDDIILFIRNEDPTHPYGVAISDSIVDLLDARKQLNMDMPKIVHRFSSPTMTVITSEDVTSIKTAIEEREPDEAVFIGNAMPDALKIEFHEPDARVKFTEYIELINFQIAEELHAPLILLLKNATEASATKMLEAVDRNNQSEQDENAETIEQKIFTRLVTAPIPEFLHGAPNSVLKDVTLDQIGTLKGNGTITFKQAQDLIRKKGIALIEDVEPKPAPILNQLPADGNEKPLLNRDKMTQLELQLQTIKAAYDGQPQKMLLTEALKEGDRAINNMLNKARMEAARQLEAAGRHLTPESDLHFRVLHDELFGEFRDSLLPAELKNHV